MARLLIVLVLVFGVSACSQPAKKEIPPPVTTDVYSDVYGGPGKLAIVQGATSTTEAYFNIMAPRNRKYKFEITHRNKAVGKITTLETIEPKNLHFKIIKIHVSDLQPSQEYELLAKISYKNSTIDRRMFRTFPEHQTNIRFVLGSCMSEDYAFKHVQDKIWDQILSHSPNLIILNGDIVYVDSYDFVPRNKATAMDIWQRYVHTMETVPLFHRKQLIPILATWDDHDYGTNDSDKSFKSKKHALAAFQAFFGSKDIAGVYENGKSGVYKYFSYAGQRFFMLDNRYFRNSRGSKNTYAHWGKTQHKWLIDNLNKNDEPAWLINGGQFFAPPVLVDGRDGKKRQINETFMGDHPIHFKTLIRDLKKVTAPVIFSSGDIHFSELLEIEADKIGYKTYEITSSPLHSYIFRNKPGQPELWDNPRRIAGAKDHNYILVDSQLSSKGWVNKVRSFGIKREQPLFAKELVIKR